MASLLALAGGALVNALAFSGSNFLFSKLSNGGEEERKRHDLAIEQLQAAHEAWSKTRQKKLDFINDRLRAQHQATQYINDLDEGMRVYYRATREKIKPLGKEPKLSDFYRPSEHQKNGELVFITVSMLGIGFVGFKYL